MYLYYVDPPRVSINPANSPHMIYVGKTLFLYCIAEGFPIPTIQWYKNHTSVPQQLSQVYLASTDTPGTTVYTCEGKNNAGNMENKAHANITVIVEGMCIPNNNNRKFAISKKEIGIESQKTMQTS